MRKLERDKYATCARRIAAEGCVLIKNDNAALPINENEKVAVFGRCAFNYYKSGLGSGGMVNVSYIVGILDALRNEARIQINEELIGIYEDWLKDNPYEKGQGWGLTPWSQKEMPITDRMSQIAAESDVSVVIIGRTAGEDQDNKLEEGSFLLTEVEKELIEKVNASCKRTVVLLNVGNIIDMKWVEKINPAAIMYVWHGGQEGGNGVLDVLMGDISPSGKLPCTIAKDINDYPSHKNFGNETKNVYAEDVYVGYRYFESFDEARKKVLYPFGYGLSYTNFTINTDTVSVKDTSLDVTVTVINSGNKAGKESVLVYAGIPEGVYGKPSKVLIGFAKTESLMPGETETLQIRCDKKNFSSYIDGKLLLEAGEYEIFVGTDVEKAKAVSKYEQDYQILEEYEEALAPVEAFECLTRKKNSEGQWVEEYELCKPQTASQKSHILADVFDAVEYTGDMGYKLSDVYNKKVDLDTFMAQLSDEDLVDFFHGEGMCSKQVTPGVAGAFGGVTDSLKSFGIPVAACADGPSGIRMDCGTKAMSLPNGAAIASSLNQELTEELFAYLGLELRKNNIDTILGPGCNILRHPLNGRNFEYYSEDPLISGKMCAASVRGLKKVGASGTIKHFCGNNQEHFRTKVEAVVTERALREIYLRPFEIAIKEGGADSIMTSYNPVNGYWAAGNYDLNTRILRKQWGYEGIVMSDWWAVANWFGQEPDENNHAPMVIAQNDIYMVCPDSEKDRRTDNVMDMLEKGVVSRGMLYRNAKNILKFLLKSQCMERLLGIEEPVECIGFDDDGDAEKLLMERRSVSQNPETDELIIDNINVTGEAGAAIEFEAEIFKNGFYDMEIEYSSEGSSLSQLPVSLYVNLVYLDTFSVNGTDGQKKIAHIKLRAHIGTIFYIKFVFGSDGMTIHNIKATPV